MTTEAKGPAIVLGPDEGESYWQPLPSTGYTTAKVTPYNSPYDGFASGIQVLEPGASVREHGHERGHELLFVYAGHGHAIVDGVRHELAPESLMMLGRRVLHRVTNDGSTQMRLLWVIFPPGLEDWFRGIGRPRMPGEREAPVFERPADVGEIQDRQRFVRPEDA